MKSFNKNNVDFTKQYMFFGESPNVSRFDQQRFPIFKELYVKQLGFFWKPDEIDLSKDNKDFKTLPENEKHIFVKNLLFQTFLDSVQSRSPQLAFLPCVSIPELESMIELWAMYESLHSFSYSWIIQNVFTDPSDVLNQIMLDDKILSRADSVTSYYDNFIEYLNYYKMFGEGKHSINGKIIEIDKRELKRKLLLCMASVNVLEGVRFYASFACSFAFAERGLMEGNSKIITLIARDENCFDDKTEILTDSGWKLFKDLDDKDLVAQFTKEGYTEFVKPDAIIKKQYSGDLILFKNKKGDFESLVTPDHRVIYLDKKDNKLKESAAKDMTMAHTKHFFASGKKMSGKNLLSDLERLLIAFQVDGSFIQGNRNEEYSDTECIPVHFFLKKQRKINRLENLLNNLKIEFTKSFKGSGFSFYVKIPLKHHYMFSKEFSWVNLKEINHEWCQEFIKELSYWNDYLNKDDSNIYYSTVNDFAADMVQAICALSGWRCFRRLQKDNKKETYSDVHRLTIIPEKDTYCVGTNENKSIVKYDGMVYCVSVPSGMIITRRNNKVVVSGNCHLAVTQNILKKWMNGDDDPEMVELWVENEPVIEQMFHDCVQQEIEWAKYLFKDGPMLGLTEEILVEYVKHIAGKRMRTLGIKNEYPVKNPITWTDKYLIGSNVQVAMQESEAISYVIGGVKHDFDPKKFSDFLT